MQTRREFLSHATVTLFLVPVAAACSNSSSASSDSCAGFEATSSVAQSHTHTVCVLTADLTNPPAAGVTYTTSTPDPTHTVTLTQANLQAIQSGQTVMVTTSTDGGHNHTFPLTQ